MSGKLEIVDAVRERENLYMLFYGDGGTGKTLTALRIALRLVNGDASKILVIDTDAGRSRHYAPSKPGGSDGIGFKAVYLDDYKPQVLSDAFAAAKEAGFEVVIVDSMSKFWNGIPGGLTQLNNQIAKKSFGGNTQAAWSKTNEHEYAIHAAIDGFLSSQGHVLLCCQEKPEYRPNTLEVIGVKPEFRGSLSYRVNFTCRMTIEPDPADKTGATKINRLTVEKSTATRLKVDGTVVDYRPIMPAGTTFDQPGPEIAEELLSHMHAGANPTDWDMKVAAYLAALEGAGRDQLLAEIGNDYEAGNIANKPWPAYIKTEARAAVVAMGRALKNKPAPNPAQPFAHLSTASTPKEWQDAIDACDTVEAVTALRDHASGQQRLETLQAALVKRRQQLTPHDHSEVEDSHSDQDTQADTVSA